jgi:hypothetical protein
MGTVDEGKESVKTYGGAQVKLLFWSGQMFGKVQLKALAKVHRR